jgi:N-acyl-D-aspartate/D-glutamate deacylase
MRDPAVREKLLGEVHAATKGMRQFLDPERTFPIGDNPDYEPKRSDSIAALAQRAGVEPFELYYDLIAEGDGTALVLRPLLNFTDFNLDCVREMLLHPSSAWGLGDGGAHCGTTCDASTPSYMLAH